MWKHAKGERVDQMRTKGRGIGKGVLFVDVFYGWPLKQFKWTRKFCKSICKILAFPIIITYDVEVPLVLMHITCLLKHLDSLLFDVNNWTMCLDWAFVCIVSFLVWISDLCCQTKSAIHLDCDLTIKNYCFHIFDNLCRTWFPVSLII